MESRKRLGSDTAMASSSRPAKRVATDPEQIPIHTDPFAYEDLSFINDFRREAIYRTLVAERRETQRLRERLKTCEAQSASHDDHLRLIDIWLKQLLEELAVTYGQYDPSREVFSVMPPSVRVLEADPFQAQLIQHRQQVLNTVTSLYQKAAASIATDSDVQTALKSALAKNNTLIADVQRLTSEREQRDERLTDTMMRLLSLEKKLDRSKSLTLAKIEAQAIQKADKDARTDESVENGDVPLRPDSRVNNRNIAELETTNSTQRAALAAIKEECASVLKEKSELLQKIAHLSIKSTSLAREDIEQSESYRLLQSEIEHLTAEVSRLEQASESLREENSSLLAERTKFKEDLVAEHKHALDEANNQIQRIEKDLTRVRGVRDDLHFELQNRKQREDETLHSAREISEIADSREMRINALEKEVERYKAQVEALPVQATSEMSKAELLKRIETLEKQNKILTSELPAMEAAFNKAHKQNQRKIMELVEHEDKLNKLYAEKAKAEQKFFSTMKSKDQLQSENRALKQQLAKTTELISKFQETEKSTIQKMESLERQLSLTDNIQMTLEKKLTESSKRENDIKISLESASTQIADLKSQITARIAAEEAEQKRRIDAVEEKTVLAVQLEAARSAVTASAGVGDSSDLDTYRRIARCGVCNDRWKDTAITLCGHVFCKTCVDRLIDIRQRRCPTCAKSFDRKDMLTVHIV